MLWRETYLPSSPLRPKAMYWSSRMTPDSLICTYSPFSVHWTCIRSLRNSRQFVTCSKSSGVSVVLLVCKKTCLDQRRLSPNFLRGLNFPLYVQKEGENKMLKASHPTTHNSPTPYIKDSILNSSFWKDLIFKFWSPVMKTLKLIINQKNWG